MLLDVESCVVGVLTRNGPERLGTGMDMQRINFPLCDSRLDLPRGLVMCTRCLVERWSS